MSSIKGRENFPAIMYYTNDSASTDEGKAQLFNNYFYSVFPPTTSSSSSVSEPQIRCDNPHVETLCFLILMSLPYQHPLMILKPAALIISAQKFLSIVQDHYF